MSIQLSGNAPLYTWLIYATLHAVSAQ